MLTEAGGLLRTGESIRDASARNRQASGPVERTLRTLLTNREFAQTGLLVMPRAEHGNILTAWAEFGDGRLGGERWLVHGAANEAAPVPGVGQEWLPVVERRIDDLRRIAEDEGLSFDATSAAAALVFLRRLRSVRQPGAFLVAGNVRLLWDAAGGEQVGLQFRGSDRIQYVIFQADDGRLGSTMGVRSHDAVRRLLLASDVFPILVR